jgi:nicotinate-nucleotide adenylyltransferase
LERRVGIFGGSFDPVHKGHVQIARSFLDSGLIQKLLVLLSPSPPHKQEKNQADYSYRFEMLKLAFKDIDGVEISDLEQNLPKPSYTLHTIEFLQEKHPDTLFYLCIGEDSLLNFHEWHRYEEILERVYLIVVKRPGVYTSELDPKILEHVIFIDHDPVSASSTAIRKAKGDKRSDLPKPVKDYIEKHKLYQ